MSRARRFSLQARPGETRESVALTSLSRALASRASHVGYYLIDAGRSALEKNAGTRLSLWTRASRIVGRAPLFAYLSGVLLITAMVTLAFLAWSIRMGRRSQLLLCLLAIPFVMCAAHLGVGVVNWLAILLVHPRPLPRLDFSDGIPPEHRTMVVVPTMLSKPEAVADLLEGLEVRYLANRDDHLHFALLTDLLDAPQEVMPQDAELVRLAKEGIEQLNQKYENIGPTSSISSTARAAGTPGRGLDGLRTQARQAGGVQRALAPNGQTRSPSLAKRKRCRS